MFEEAEERLMAADPQGALERYLGGLEELALKPPGERARASGARWPGEADLALTRLHEIASERAAARAARPAFERWMDMEVAGDPCLASLARFFAGTAAVRSGAIEEGERIWEPLGFLRGWRVAGPFENERGGGFETDYGPEKDLREAQGAGKLFRPDPGKSYPGKVRPVAFRSLPVAPLYGRVDFDELFRPADEALGYALTYLECERDLPAALRLGSDDGYRLWVNGELLASRDVRRPLRFDQDAVAVRLRKGWNTVLLKVAESKGNWEFLARLTRPDGGPLTGAREGEPPEDAPPAAAGARGAPGQPDELPAPALGARGALKALADAEPGARTVYLLGAILHGVRAHDDGDHPDRDLLRQAISLRKGPAPAIYHYVLALASDRDTQLVAERDDNDWREAMEAALAADPPSLRAGLDLAGYFFESFGNLSRAERLVESVLAARPGLPEAVLLQGKIDRKREFPAALARAIEECAAAIDRPQGLPAVLDPEAARRVAGRLRAQGRLDRAEELLVELLGRDRFDYAAREALVDLLLARGRGEEALRLLDERARIGPFETAARRESARVLEGLERPVEALAALRQAGAIAPEDHAVLFEEGKLLLKLGRTEEALAVWDRALAIQPNFPELRQYADFVRKARDDFAERYRRDAGEAIARALGEPAGGDEPVRVLLDLTAVRVNPDGTAKEFRQYVARAMNDRGIRALGRRSTHYSRGEQRVEFKAARVHRPGGRREEARLTVHGGPGEADGSWASASVDLPPLATGDVVEVEHTTEDLRQSFFGDYFGRREHLRGEHPIAERTFVLEAPAARRLHFHQRNLDLAPEVRRDDARGTAIHTWTLRDVEASRPEPGMPPDDETDPLVEVSTFASWDEFARWYWNLIRHQFELSPPIGAKVQELTSGKAGEAEKIRAIYDFVTGEVRYNAWEFGVHGFKPYNASAIFQRRFGDCKDKATLLCTMLGAAGIRAHPVLIHATEARWNEDLSIPMVDHFNHCIAYVPASGGRPAMYLDGTAERHAFDELPGMDRGAKVLIVREGGGGLAEVGWNRPEETSIEEVVEAEIAPDRSARLRVRARARGDMAADLRSHFEVAGRRRVELERIYGARFAGAAVESEEFSNLADRSRPVEFQAVLKVPSIATRGPEGEALLVFDDLFETARRFGRLGGLEERRHDLILGPPRRQLLRGVYLLPAGARVRSLPEPSEIQGRFGRLAVRYQRTAEGGRPAVTVAREFETTAPRVPRSDYAEFRELASALARLKDEKILIEGAR